MADAITVSGPISGTDRTLSFETGKLAQQADGAVVARIGDTDRPRHRHRRPQGPRGHRLLPAHRRHRGADVRRRARSPARSSAGRAEPTDQAILTCRLIDRPLRPSFPKGFRNEIHVVGTIFGADQVNPHDVLAINGASAALMLSGIPFDGPIGAVRVAYSTEGTWIPHPTYQEGDASTFELVVAGRALSRGRRRRDRHHDGRGRRHRARPGSTTRTAPRRSPKRCSPRASRRPRPGSASRSTSSASSSAHGRRARPTIPYELFSRLRRRRLRRGSRRSAPTLVDQGQRDHRQGRAQRRPRRGDRRRSSPQLAGEFAGRERRDQGRRPLAHEEARPQAHRRGGRPHRRPRHRPTSARCRPRSASSRPPTARRCSSGARPRC